MGFLTFNTQHKAHRRNPASSFLPSWHSPVVGPQEDGSGFPVFFHKMSQLYPLFTNKGGSEKLKESQ